MTDPLTIIPMTDPELTPPQSFFKNRTTTLVEAAILALGIAISLIIKSPQAAILLVSLDFMAHGFDALIAYAKNQVPAFDPRVGLLLVIAGSGLFLTSIS
jgi:hypothetical protein